MVFSVIGRRMRFRDAVAYAGRELRGRAVIVANADVFFDEDSLRRFGDSKTLELESRVFALLRWEWTCTTDAPANADDLSSLANKLDENPRLVDLCGRFRPRADSQDAWIFRAPLPALGLDAELGRAKCDNRVTRARAGRYGQKIYTS